MKKIIIPVVLVLLIASVTIFLVAKNSDPIVGTWEGTVLNMKTVYVFNKDGTYESFLQSTIADGSYGTYSIKDGMLTLVQSNGKTNEIRYSLNGNTLILTTKLGDKDVDTILMRAD